MHKPFVVASAALVLVGLLLGPVGSPQQSLAGPGDQEKLFPRRALVIRTSDCLDKRC